jgi:hypothetical protein
MNFVHDPQVIFFYFVMILHFDFHNFRFEIELGRSTVASGIAVISAPVSEDVGGGSDFVVFESENFVSTAASEDSGTAGS